MITPSVRAARLSFDSEILWRSSMNWYTVVEVAFVVVVTAVAPPPRRVCPEPELLVVVPGMKKS